MAEETGGTGGVRSGDGNSGGPARFTATKPAKPSKSDKLAFKQHKFDVKTEDRRERVQYNREHPKPGIGVWILALVTGIPVVGPIVSLIVAICGWIAWLAGIAWATFKVGVIVVVLAIAAGCAYGAYGLFRWIANRFASNPQKAVQT